MVALFYVCLFALGTAFGSFLNVLTLRYQPERSAFSATVLGGRSHCPHCRKKLAWYELIPVISFFVQGMRCRSCRARLSIQYPLVELASGALWVAVPLFLNSFYGISNVSFASLTAPLWCYLLAFLWIFAFLAWLAIVIIDLRHYLIPDELNLFIGALGVLVIIIASLYHAALPAFRDSFLQYYALLASSTPLAPWASHLIGAAAGGLIFGFIALAGRGRAMGMGDVKLALASGLLLGWPDIALATAVAFVVGGAWGAALVFAGKKRFGSRLPFAPFLVFGIAATVFFGYPLLFSYFSFLGF